MMPHVVWRSTKEKTHTISDFYCIFVDCIRRLFWNRQQGYSWITYCSIQEGVYLFLRGASGPRRHTLVGHRSRCVCPGARLCCSRRWERWNFGSHPNHSNFLALVLNQFIASDGFFVFHLAIEDDEIPFTQSQTCEIGTQLLLAFFEGILAHKF